jgi:hypothetical protein
VLETADVTLSAGLVEEGVVSTTGTTLVAESPAAVQEPARAANAMKAPRILLAASPVTGSPKEGRTADR